MNSSHYTMWNMRRDVLLFKTLKERAALDTELKLTQRCLMSNPKSYCVWEHRRWCVEQTHAQFEGVLAAEMALCEKFHSYDERNFHCWNYRRWLLQQDTAIPEDEQRRTDLAYTLRRIHENFSNYSAWHQRSLSFDGADLGGEFDLIFNGIYTSPEDQSLWMYLYWLLDMTRPQDFDLVHTLATHCVQLCDMDGETKWPLLTLYFLLSKYDFEAQCQRNEKTLPAINGKNANQIIESLCSIDPMRKGYYQSLVKK